MMERFEAMKAVGCIATAGANAVVLESLAAIDNNTIGAVNGSKIADDAHGPG